MKWPVYVAVGLENIFVALENIMQKYHYRSLYRAYLHYLEYYPVTTVLSTISFVTYAIPVVFFIGFGLLTAVVTFSGFLLIEGTILGGALIVLLMVLTFISCCLSVLILGCWIFCYIFAQLFEIASMNVTMEPMVVCERECNQNNRLHRLQSEVEES